MKFNKEMIILLKLNDEIEWKKFYFEYCKIFKIIAYKYKLTEDELNEIKQTAFLKIYKYFLDNEIIVKTANSLIKTIIENNLCDFLKNKKYDFELIEEKIEDTTAKIDLIRYDLKCILKNNEMVEVIYLNVIYGYSLIEIAKMKNISIIKVKRLKKEGLKKIKVYYLKVIR